MSPKQRTQHKEHKDSQRTRRIECVLANDGAAATTTGFSYFSEPTLRFLLFVFPFVRFVFRLRLHSRNA
jgi:hypothetical protein